MVVGNGLDVGVTKMGSGGKKRGGGGDADWNVVRLTQRVSRQSRTKLAEGIGRFYGGKITAKKLSEISDFAASDFRKILISGWTETHVQNYKR